MNPDVTIKYIKFPKNRLRIGESGDQVENLGDCPKIVFFAI
ncbi:hypothetical protein FHW36_1021 [Chitinophaga polysaccharea]|uniref:Uncharacterized protein n=1 Tax=Chitinophaga polysaccharea TaxID=1293035 RepID=A0A561PVU0_9BACT|nr:hypothetical protein FHW36_1021 [Chitinophaga polysaccharea]